MKKPGTKWIMKQFTGSFERHPDGTLHRYDYFEDDSGEWIYNITFHIRGCFGPIQLREKKRIPIQQAIKKARQIFNNTTWVDQPNTDY